MNKLFLILLLVGCSPAKKTKPCTQCPQYTNLKEQIDQTHIILYQIEQDYYALWEENQMLKRNAKE